MDSQVARPLPWPVRSLVQLASSVSSALWPTGSLRAVALGDSWSFSTNVTAAAGLEAYEADPWFRAALNAKASDAAGLPLYAFRQDGGTKVILGPDQAPPLLRLLRRPARGVTGREYRVQSYIDYQATGDAISWLEPEGTLRRLNPACVTVDSDKIDRWGEPTEWRWTDARGNSQRILDGAIVHVRAPSGATVQAAPRGSSPIRALGKGIQTAAESKRLAASQAGSGQFRYMIILPKGTQDSQRAAIEAQLESKLASGKQFVAVYGEEASFQQMSPTIRQMEYGTVHEISRDEIAAACGVPPTRLGVTSAGYGAAKQEDRAYWGAMSTGLLAFFEDAWGLHVPPDFGIAHDLSDVASLRTVQLDQLEAAEAFRKFGISAKDALEYVGLEDAADMVDEDGDGQADGGAGGRPTSADPDPQELDLVHSIRAALAQAGRAAERHDGRDPVAVDRWRVLLADHGAPVDLAPTLALEEEVAVEMARATTAGRDGSDLAGLHHLAVFGDDRARRIAADLAARKAA